MEPTGTYGDALRGLLVAEGWPVYRVGPKRVHDAAEAYDGVPSLHDAKAAYVMGRLHLDGVSDAWEEVSDERREMKALQGLLRLYRGRYRRGLNRLEAQLARHWPEVLEGDRSRCYSCWRCRGHLGGLPPIRRGRCWRVGCRVWGYLVLSRKGSDPAAGGGGRADDQCRAAGDARVATELSRAPQLPEEPRAQLEGTLQRPTQGSAENHQAGTVAGPAVPLFCRASVDRPRSGGAPVV